MSRRDVVPNGLDEQAERVLAQACRGAFAEAELGAQRVLAICGSEASPALANAHQALAHVRVGAGDDASLEEAARCFAEAAGVWAVLGDDPRHLHVVLTAIRELDLRRGRFAQVAERATALLAGSVGSPAAFQIRLLRAEAAVASAEVETAASDLELLLEDSGAPIADQVRAALLAAEVAALGGDAMDTLEFVQVATGLGSVLSASVLADVHAAGADLLDVAGDRNNAWDQFHRARQLGGDRGSRRLVATEISLHARHGDPALAEEAAVALRRFPQDVGEDWRLLLLRAYAAHRRRDHRAARLAARAFDAAAIAGTLEQIHLREPEAARTVHPLAVSEGSPAAAELPLPAPQLHVMVLGTFAVERGGAALELNEQGARIVKLLACGAGGLHVDELTSFLWPDADPTRGRQRLRNALTRLRRVDEHLVVRDGDLVRFGDAVAVDVAVFEREARLGLAAMAADGPAGAAIARSAVSCYDELLPFDRYFAWTHMPRERLRRLYLAVLDALVHDAQVRGDLDGAVALVHRGLEAQPPTEERYLEAARLHLARGDRSQARRMLDEAERLARELDLPNSSQHRQLLDQLTGR